MNNLVDTVMESEYDGDDYDAWSIYKSDWSDERHREVENRIDMEKTLENLLKEYTDAVVYNCSSEKLSNSIIFDEEFIYCNGVFLMDTPKVSDRMAKCIAEKEYKPQIRWISRGTRGGIEQKYMDITPRGDIKENYNDDFWPVHEKITKLIHSDESSIIILHGKPGTGKTSYIRDLIDSNRDVTFYWVDSSIFNYIDSSDFIQFIVSCKNAVFVLEDSESLLASREHSRNPAMQSLLSISNGMLGDSLKIKFICTFNTDHRNVDKAITRKGRMRVKYEFKDLKKEKVEKIFTKMGVDASLAKDMPLCDVYNYLDDNGTADNSKKIGF
jgi:hypothetical protein